MSKCIEQITSKYTKRGSPPYPAMDCKNRVMLGNDENVYKSKPDKNGTYKWIKTANGSIKSRSRSTRIRKSRGKSRSRKASRKSRSRKSRSRSTRIRKSRGKSRSRKASRKSRSRKSRSRKSRSRKDSRKSRSRKSRSRKSRSRKASRKSRSRRKVSRKSTSKSKKPDFDMFTQEGNNKVFKIVQEAIKKERNPDERWAYALDKMRDLKDKYKKSRKFREITDSAVTDSVFQYLFSKKK
jgi:hypothetical protein